MTAAWTLTGLTVSRAGAVVLNGVDLSVEPGEMVGVLGPNGAGKTTLVRAGLGLIRLASGLVELGGRPLAALSEARRAALVGYLPQERSPAWNLPAWQVAALGAVRSSPMEGQMVAHSVLEDLGVAALADRGVLDMSGGERARVLLARLLVTRAPLLVADEPAAGLDPEAQLMILERLRAAARSGAAVVVTLHDLGLAARLCDRLLVLHDGAAAAQGPAHEALRPQILRSVFGLDGQLIDTPAGLVLAAGRADRHELGDPNG